MSVYPATDNVLEPALGLLTSMMLRLPEIATKAAEVRRAVARDHWSLLELWVSA